MTRLRGLLAIVVLLLAAVTVVPLYMVALSLALHFAHTVLLLLPPGSSAARVLALWLGAHHRCWKCGAEGPRVADLQRIAR